MRKIRSKRSIIGVLLAAALTIATAMVLPSPAHASLNTFDVEFGIVNTGAKAVVVAIEDADCDPDDITKGMGVATGNFVCTGIQGTGPLGAAVIDLTCDVEWDPWPVDQTTTLDLTNCVMDITIGLIECSIEANISFPANFLNGEPAGWWQADDLESGFDDADCPGFEKLAEDIDMLIDNGTKIGLGFTFYDDV